MNWQRELREIDREMDSQLAPVEAQEGLQVFDLDLLDGEPPPDRDWALQNYVPADEVTALDGGGGDGKSLLVHQWANCIAAQVPFLGLPPMWLWEEQGDSVAYITCEDSEEELHRRQIKLMAALGITRADLGDRLKLCSLRGFDETHLAAFNRDGGLEVSNTWRAIHRFTMNSGARLLILDNVGHLFAGNENDRSQVTRFINLLYAMVRQLGVTIVLVGHPNKRGDTYSGSTAWLNAVRSQIHLSRVEDEHGNVIDPDARVLTLGKANYARAGQTLQFRWHNGAFWRDEDLPRDVAADLAQAAKANGENAAYLRCLAAATARKRAVSENSGTNYFAAVFAKMPEGKGQSKEAFKRAHERLLAIGAIELDARLWQRGNRTWKYGIRAVDMCTDQPHRPDAPTATDQGVNAARTDQHIPKGITGAAPVEPPAPDNDGWIGESPEQTAARLRSGKGGGT